MIIQSEREKQFEELRNAITRLQESDYIITGMQMNNELVSKDNEWGRWVNHYTFNIQIDYMEVL